MKTIKQKIIFKATPEDVYEALMDSKKHSKFTGSKAVISRRVGGKFTCYDGSLSGETIELVANKRIVQRWRSDDWPEDCSVRASGWSGNEKNQRRHRIKIHPRGCA